MDFDQVAAMPGLKTYTHYDENGRLTYSIAVLESMMEHQLAHVVAGGGLLEGKGDPDTEYVKDGAMVPRPANPATLAGMTLENLPVPCTVTVEDVEHACEESTAELSFSQAGTYPVKVSAWPMLDATFEVTQV
jgi:hypothetical protein